MKQEAELAYVISKYGCLHIHTVYSYKFFVDTRYLKDYLHQANILYCMYILKKWKKTLYSF